MVYSLMCPVNFGSLGFSSLKLHVNCVPAAFVPCASSYCLHYSLDIVNAIIITLCCTAIQAFRVRGLDIVTGAVMLGGAHAGGVLVSVTDTLTCGVPRDSGGLNNVSITFITSCIGQRGIDGMCSLNSITSRYMNCLFNCPSHQLWSSLSFHQTCLGRP